MQIVDCLDQSSALKQSYARFIDLDNDVSLSYQDMVNASVHIAQLLLKKGVKAQDVVAIYAPNSVAAYCCLFAISRMGAVLLALNAKNTFDANLKLLKKSSTVLLFVDDRIASTVPELSDHFSEDQLIRLNGRDVGGLNFRSLSELSTAIFDQTSEQMDEEDRLVALFATGGTTGDSKLAEWSALTFRTMISIQSQLMPKPDIPATYLVAAPMTHAAGVASYAPILQGANILVMDGMVPEVLLSTIEQYRVTHLFLPPTAIYILLTHKTVAEHDYSSLRYFFYAAAPMSVEKLKQAMATFGPVMLQTFGQAEVPMFCTCLSVQDHIDALRDNAVSKMRSCGKTSPQMEVAVIDDEGQILAPGQEGEIAVKGKLLMRGYHKDPQATAAIRTNGWQRTGDIGVFDPEGYLSIVDRKRDMIISGGFNVYPSEIEQLLWALPTIQDCAVIGIPHDKWGEQVTAIIELKDKEAPQNAEEIISLCKQKLGSVKAPKEVFFWDELPKSPVGKVLKKEIRKVFWDKSDRRI